MILDFFHGDEVDRINLAGLDRVISCTIGSQSDPVTLANAFPSQPIMNLAQPIASTSSSSDLPLIHFRTYSTKLLNSGSRTPLIGIEEVGPSFDFRLRRTQVADGDRWKAATKKPKKAVAPGQIAGQKRKDRNVDIDDMGDKVGKLHVGKQDLGKLQTRKMRGLKKSKDTVEEALAGETLDEDVQLPGAKRPRV